MTPLVPAATLIMASCGTSATWLRQARWEDECQLNEKVRVPGRHARWEPGDGVVGESDVPFTGVEAGRLRGLAAVGDDVQRHIEPRGELATEVDTNPRIDGTSRWRPGQRTHLTGRRVSTLAINRVRVVDGRTESPVGPINAKNPSVSSSEVERSPCDLRLTHKGLASLQRAR